MGFRVVGSRIWISGTQGLWVYPPGYMFLLFQNLEISGLRGNSIKHGMWVEDFMQKQSLFEVPGLEATRHWP